MKRVSEYVHKCEVKYDDSRGGGSGGGGGLPYIFIFHSSSTTNYGARTDGEIIILGFCPPAVVEAEDPGGDFCRCAN